MAPPIPVYSQDEIRSMFPDIFNKTNKSCKLYELTQQQCTFVSGEVICLPFKRVFARCLVNQKVANIGAQKTGGFSGSSNGQKNKSNDLQYISVELTDSTTNDYKQFNAFFKDLNNGEDILRKFLDADKVLRQAHNIKPEKSQ